MNLFLSISMAYNVISCRKIAENTQILKIAKFPIKSSLPSSDITQNIPPKKQITQSQFAQIFELVWYMKGGTWGVGNPHVQRFRICMAKGGRESARPSYGRPKLTLITRERKKSPSDVLQKASRPQFRF